MSGTDDSAAIVKASLVAAELVSNERWPEKQPIAHVTHAVIEQVEHDRYGESVISEVYGLSREFIQHERYGESILAETYWTAADLVVGDRYAVPIHNQVGSVCIELLIKDSPLKISHASLEILLDDPNAPRSVSHVITGQRQYAIAQSNPWPDPASVWSWTHVRGMVQQVVYSSKRLIPHSPIDVNAIGEQVVSRRVVTPVAEMLSKSTLKGYRQIAVVSKSMKAISISAVFLKGMRHQTLTARVTDRPDTLQGSIMVNGLRTQAIHSRGAMPFAVNVMAERLQQLAVTGRSAVAPISPNSVKRLAQQVVVRKIMPEYADVRSGMVKQAAIVKAGERPTPRSPEELKLAVQQAVVQASSVPPISHNMVRSARGYTVQRRWTPTPGYLLGWRVPALTEYAAVERKPDRNWSPLHVASQHLQFIVGRDVVAPIDVIDPTVGRHVKSLVRSAAIKRLTQAPAELIAQSRYVSNVLQAYVLREPDEALPPPPTEEPKPPVDATAFAVAEAALIGEHEGWAAVSALRIQLSAECLLIGDESWPWLDPRVPLSDIDANLVFQSIAVEDAFVPSWVPQSDAEVSLLGEQVALEDDSLPGMDVARSDAELLAISEQVALEDTTMPPSYTVLSDAIVSRLSVTPVYGDHTLRTLPVSPTTAYNLVEFLVMADPMLMRMSRRRAGPRPVVTVTLS